MDLERLSYTVVEGISALGMGRFQYMLLVYVGLGALGKAMELMCMTDVGLAAQHNLELSITDQNIIFVFTYIAIVVEALIWGFVMDLERLSYTVNEGISPIRMGRFQYMILTYTGVRAQRKRTVCNFDLYNFQSYGCRSIDMRFCCRPLGKKMDLKRLSYTVDEGISAIGMGRFQYMILAYAGVGALGKAMEFMCMTYVDLSITHQNIIFVFTYIAMVVGALIWGFVVDRLGRKWGIFGLSLVTSVTGLASAVSKNRLQLLVLRVVVGLGIGGAQVYTSWYMEFVP
nr:organic cation/carnitine transporter 7-like [Tanacetum cinerariifolium]